MQKTTLIPISSTLIAENPGFADIVAEFVKGLPQRSANMRDCLAHRKFGDLRRLAHQLKGAGGGYGYDILTDLGRELEDAALKENHPACAQTLEKLTRVVERVIVGGP